MHAYTPVYYGMAIVYCFVYCLLINQIDHNNWSVVWPIFGFHSGVLYSAHFTVKVIPQVKVKEIRIHRTKLVFRGWHISQQWQQTLDNYSQNVDNYDWGLFKNCKQTIYDNSVGQKYRHRRGKKNTLIENNELLLSQLIFWFGVNVSKTSEAWGKSLQHFQV